MLGASPETDALLLLERLLDSLPIGFFISEPSDDFRLVYGNRAWESWAPSEQLPTVGKRFLDVIQSDGAVATVMRAVRDTREPQHLRGFKVAGLRASTSDALWDWEVYPLLNREGAVGHLLVCAMDVSDSAAETTRAAKKQAEIDRLREEASGVLRIFGVAPGAGQRGPGRGEALTDREREVADLVALGLRNSDIAKQLFVSRATVASHIAAILMKLQFRSRTQIAAWVVEERLRSQSG